MIKKCTQSLFTLLLVSIALVSFNSNAQTTLINPLGDGGFNNGNTFAANGWTVANQGVSPVKWVVGTAASGTSSVGSVTASSTSVTLSAPNTNIAVGQMVYGSGIPANTFVSAIAGTALTLSQQSTLTGSNVTLGFGMFSGGISVATIQNTTASVGINSYTLVLSAANPNISVGMAIAPIAGVIDPNTYVASINGTALGLSQRTANTAALVTAQTLIFSATSATIAGNAAYISNDNGVTNSYGGYPTNRTVYFYRDITTVPANEKAMTLTFDVKSAPASGGGWQIFVAPITQTVTGTDTQVTPPFTYLIAPTTSVWAGATLISFNSNPQVATTKTTAFIPKSFAGTSFRLIFVWTNGTSAGTLPPAAIDNISLTSRIPEEITCANSGLWSQPTTWNGGKVPTPADSAVLESNAEVVMVDSRYSGCEDLTLAGTNTLLQFAISTVVDEFRVNNDVNIAASGARFNNHDGTNGRYLKVGHDFTVGANARFDSQLGTGLFGRLNLNGSTLQTVTVDPAGFVGGSVAGVNTTSNVSNVLSGLEVTNTATVSPNVVWNADGVRIKSNLTLTTGRVSITAGKRLILGNFGQLTAANLSVTPGSGFKSGTVSKWMLSANTDNVQAGTEYPGNSINSTPSLYPFISGASLSRRMYILLNSNATTAGEIAVTYTDATTSTGSLSISDGGYTINNRYDGNWSVTTPNSSVTATPLTYTSSTNHRVMVYATGAYQAIDGSSRLMNVNSALAGTHQEGTEQPFVVRTDLSLANMIAAPIYIGFSDGSKVSSSNTITSTVTGGDRNWNTAATWVGGVVPGCTNNVIIASGATVTVSATANAASVVINSGGTLTNNGGTMTVGCTNNNNAFINYGTHTMTSGTLKVNGFVAHKLNSFFNQTGGDIIIDSNDNGTVATSVAFGGSSCKIETSNLALTGGKITIVDPLVNEAAPIVITSASSIDLVTPSTGTYTTTTNAIIASGSSTLTMVNPDMFFVGQTVSGTGIATGTTVTSVTAVNGTGTTPYTLGLSNNTIASIPVSTSLTFSAMHNGGTAVVVAPNANNLSIAAGSAISGTGIQPGTTITSIVFSGFNADQVNVKLNLSLPVSGLTTSPATSAVTLSMPSFTVGSLNVVLPVANTSLINGMPVSGTGLLPGTFIVDVQGAKITFSSPIQSGAPTPLVFNVYPDTAISSGAFVYSGSNYAAGLNHTLQIGDGVSTQKGAVLTNGFNCVFWSSNGMFSLGNLTIDAPDGDNRFMSTNNFGKNTALGTMNVQNQLTITAGSTLKKLNGNNTYYVGGNIVNNGSFLQPTASSPLYLGNFINQVAVPTSLAQTISGTGLWSNNQYSLASNSPTGAISSLTINNTNPAGVTLQVPNFRSVLGVALTNGILYTSAAYPIYCGVADVTGPFFGGQYSGGSATSYIDGPCFHANKSDANINQFRLFPTGKNGKYLPISISSTGGVELMAEAFDMNSGTINTANASGLSANRWKLSRVGTAGTFTGYNVKLGATEITSSKIIVHSATENGTYDIVSTPASATMTYTAGTPNTINLNTAQTGGYLGNFAFADAPACSGTPAPVATASATTVCSGQTITFSLTGLTGASLTYQWQSSTNGGTSLANISGATSALYTATPSVNTSYQCVVTCSSVSGTSNAIAVTVSQSVATTTGGSVCASGVVNLSATGSAILNWYDAATGGNLVATGATYSPTVTATTTYYVGSASVSAGSSLNTVAYAGTGVSTALFKGISFDVTNPIKLNTVTVYPKNTAALTPITVSLFDTTGSIVSGTSPVTFTPTLNTGTVGTISQVVTLNYNIPIGTGYRLVATYGLIATTNTLGNSTGTITYPAISGGLRINGNISALNDAVVTTANTTNCFHNLTFDEKCESVTRTAVIATVNPAVTPTFTQVAAICSGATLSALPLTSNNGITGTWSPVISNTVTTTYTFTPTTGLCATTATMTITVNPNVTPTFTQVAPVCYGTTFVMPTTSNNGITGTWSPAFDNTMTMAYVFTPTSGTCATQSTMSVTVNPRVTPTFTQVAAICSGATLAALPTTSSNAITGTWSPAISNTATTTYTFTPTVGLCATTATMTVTVNPRVTPTFTQISAICSGATLAALPLTSNNAITGTWLPAISNTATTTYTFTPTAGLCATTATMTITVNPNVTPTFTQVGAICSGATLAALPTTSNNAITGTWSPAISNTATTTYTFTPTAGLCATTATMTITVNPNVTPTFTQVAPVCYGTTFAMPTTSNNGISGTWSPAFDNTMTMPYVFTPTSGTCATQSTMSVTVNPRVTPTFTQVAAICSGSTGTVLPTTSNNGVTGIWSPAINNIATTTYTFTPTTGLCATTATMTITVNSTPAPTGAATQSLSSTLTVGSIIVTGSGIVWYSSAANATSGTNPLPNTTVLTNTTYYATQTIGGCASTLSLAVTITTLANPEFESIKFSYSPNPVIDQLLITANNVISSIEVYNLIGQRVQYLEPNISVTNVDFSNLPSAIYLVKLSANGVTKDIKVIKK